MDPTNQVARRMNLGRVSRFLACELLKQGDADGLDLRGIPEECSQRAKPCPRAFGSHPRRGGQRSHLVEANDVHLTSLLDLKRADIRPVSDPRGIHAHQSSCRLDRHRRVLAQGSFVSVWHEATIGSREAERIGLRFTLLSWRMPAPSGSSAHPRNRRTTRRGEAVDWESNTSGRLDCRRMPDWPPSRPFREGPRWPISRSLHMVQPSTS